MMKRAINTAALIIVMAAGQVAYGAIAENPVAIFATERGLGRAVKSCFSFIPSGSCESGLCESTVMEVFAEAGFLLSKPTFSELERAEARRVRAVFDRYADLSMLPNDTAVRAAKTLDPNAWMAILCGAKTTTRRAKRGKPAAVCVETVCKAVDIAAGQRIATSVGKRCEEVSQRTEASPLAMQGACRDAAAAMAHNLGGR